MRKTVERFGMDLSRPLVMVSGGPDSVALLQVLVELEAEPTVVHLDHGLRGEESREDAEFVENLCRSLEVPCEVCCLELEGERNFQERARIERYRVAEEVADWLGLVSIVTGHIADDVAETVLMNLARGTGLRGLTGIPPVRGRFMRPLIEVTRTEVLEYLARLQQPYRTDPTNLTGKYARNRVRQEVLPVLEDLYNGAGKNMARAADLLREDLNALKSIAGQTIHLRKNEIFLLADELLALPYAVRRYAVRRAYSELLPGTPGLEKAHVESALGLLKKGEGTRTLDLPGGVRVAGRTTGELAFYHALAAEQESVEVEKGLVVFGGWEIEVQEDVEFDAGDAGRAEVAYLDAALGPYRVRIPREGDIIRPLGLGGSKKVLRAMMDRGVPKDLRRHSPVVVDTRGVVAWIPCGELSEEHKVGGETEKILRLEVRKSRGDV
ncbi:MAG: tRNA lysidine(34) synthetase TilS [Rubrobacteraceae bacterium]